LTCPPGRLPAGQWSPDDQRDRPECTFNGFRRRNPQKAALIYSDQGSLCTSHEWQSFLKSHALESSKTRRGNCHDNAVAESFFQLLKRERIKKKIFGTREGARSDIFDYIEMFYNSKRRHGAIDKMPPTEHENQYYQ